MQAKLAASHQHQFRARRASLPAFRFLLRQQGRIKMLTRNLSIELALFGTINNIAPVRLKHPSTQTLNDPVKVNALLDNIPLKRLGKARRCGFDAVFLRHPNRTNATGTTFFVDGG